MTAPNHQEPLDKHDPEITPLPAPLPGLSMEVDALQQPVLNETTDPQIAPPVAAPPVAASPVSAPPPEPRGRLWWVIGGLGLFALGLGVGAMMWQPHQQPDQPPPVSQPLPPPLPSLPSAPLQVTQLATEQPIANPTAVPVGANPPVAAPTGTPPAPVPPVAAPTTPTETGNTPAQLPLIPNRPTPEQPTAPPPEVQNPPGPAAEQPLPPTVTTSTPPATKPPRTPRVATARPPKTPAVPIVAAKATPVAAPAPSLEPVKQLSPATMRQIMLNAEGKFKTCIREAWGTNISIGIVVEASGQVQKADILGPIAQSGTGRCISEQIRRLHFPAFTEGGATKQFFWSYQIPVAN